MRVAAFGSGGYTSDLAQAFCRGCDAHGIDCRVYPSTYEPLPDNDAVWIYGLHATQRLFDAYARRALRIVGDLGYWREDDAARSLLDRKIRISLDAQQPDWHLRKRVHPLDRFNALNLNVTPVRERGAHVLVCGHDPLQARRHGYAYGQWEAQTIARLSVITKRELVLRVKPGCPPIEIPGVAQSTHARASSAIREAWAVVCLTGNIGADAILHGVPVCAEHGPGAVYMPLSLYNIDEACPLPDVLRERALADLAYWQWSMSEIERGELVANLLLEKLM